MSMPIAGVKRHPVRRSDCRENYHPSIHNIRQVFVDGVAIKQTFFFDLDEGRVGSFDTRGDGVPHLDETGEDVERVWLTGRVEFEDVNGVRWA